MIRARVPLLLGVLFASFFLSASLVWAEPVLSTPGSGAAASGPQIPEVNDAINKFKNMDFDGALALLKTAASKNADLSPAQVLMAHLYSQVNRAADMRVSLERAVMEEPSDPEAYLILAEIALLERRVTEADLLLTYAKSLLDQFEKSETRKKTMIPRSLAAMATVAEARDDWAGAQKQLEAWLAVDSQSAVARQRLARALFQQKKVNEALDQLKAAAKIDKNVLTPEATIARFFEATGKHEEANTWMATALKSNPKDYATQMAAANWAAETAQYDRAKQYATAALELRPDSLDAKLTMGIIALLLRDYPAAEQYFTAALQQSPSNFAASNNLALALCEQDKTEKRQRALEYAAVNVRQYPKQPEAFSTLGWVYYKLGRTDDAEQALNTAVSAGQFSPDTAYYLAKVYVDRDKKTAAKQLLEAAMKLKNPLFTQRKEAQALLDQLK